MEKLFNIEISDIIHNAQSSPNFNNEMIIVTMDGSAEVHTDYRVHLDAFSLLLKLAGSLDLIINGRDYHVDSNAMLHILDVHTVQNIRRTPDFRGYHIIISHKMMEETMRGLKRLPISNLLSCFSNPIMEITDTEAALFEEHTLKIIDGINRQNHVFHRDVVKNEIRGLMLEVSNVIVKRSHIENASKYRSKDDIVAQFVLLANKYAIDEHSVGFYAEKLCVEVKYLSRILKAATGKTANKWIDDVIMIHAQIMLKDNDLSIQQIVDILHFSDQSSFGKFFKKHAGISPFSYRNEKM